MYSLLSLPLHSFRLLIVLSFQSRLQVIIQTMVVAAPELLHLLVIILTITVMWAVHAHLLIGWRQENVSTLADSMYWASVSMLDFNRTAVSFRSQDGVGWEVQTARVGWDWSFRSQGGVGWEFQTVRVGCDGRLECDERGR